MSAVGTFHGSRERIWWGIEVTDDTAPHPSTSTMLYGENEDEAREAFARRSKAMHRGKTMRLIKTVHVEAWTHHTDAVRTATKPAQIKVPS